MGTEQKKAFLLNVVYWLFIALVVYVLFEYLLPIVLPFLIGYLIAVVINKVAKKIKYKTKFVRIVLAIVFYMTIGFFVVLGVLKCITFVYDFGRELPTFYNEKIEPVYDVCYKWIVDIADRLDPSMTSGVKQIAESAMSSVHELLSNVISYVVTHTINIVKGIPGMFISVLTTIISTFFFVADYEKIAEFYETYVPQKWKKGASEVRYYFKNTLFVVIRSYLIIMCLTFTELSIMFSLFGIEHPIILAACIAVFDIMPILGCGGIMIPWAIIAMIMGNVPLGLKVLFIYIIVTIVRNFVEPKIVGTQLGLHPLITLVAMFIGLRLFGFIGMFGLPVGISFIWKNYNKDKGIDVD